MKFYAILLLTLATPMILPAQTVADSNKYKIELPSFWNRSGSTYRHFDTALQHHFAPLAGKRICTKRCNARYLVTLVYTEPVFEDPVATNFVSGSGFVRYIVLTPYRFRAMLLFRDAAGRNLDSIHLVDSTEVHVLKTVVEKKVDFAKIPEPDVPYNGTQAELRRESAVRRSGQAEEQAAAMSAQARNDAPPVLGKTKIDKEVYVLALYSVIDERFKGIR